MSIMEKQEDSSEEKRAASVSTSGKLAMRDGQSAAVVVIQVSWLLIAVTPFAVSVRVWLGGRVNITACFHCLCDIYFS